MPKHGTWMDMVCMLGVSWLSCDDRGACAFGTCLPCKKTRNLRSPSSRCGPGRVGRMETIHENKSTQKGTKKNQKHKTSVQKNCALTAWYWTLPCALKLLTTVHLKTFDHCIRLYPVGLFLVCNCTTKVELLGLCLPSVPWALTSLTPFLSVPGDGLVMGHEPCERHFPPQFVTPLALRPGCSFVKGTGFPMELNGPMGLFNGHHWVFRVRIF